tara:strand:- start:13782 stop:14084 length:303 start_codon:yes stop_codon:yes gene_type:complete
VNTKAIQQALFVAKNKTLAALFSMPILNYPKMDFLCPRKIQPSNDCIVSNNNPLARPDTYKLTEMLSQTPYKLNALLQLSSTQNHCSQERNRWFQNNQWD